ncbi:MAG: hypothetical protein KDB46_13650 [Solirubrobacterales bacterium]|nr:hypothetical protein [Solirubrobacterales bacterium]
MIQNPFSRKPKTPVDQALDAFDTARAEAAQYAETIRDAAADIAETLSELGPPVQRRKLPLLAAAAAAALGNAYLARSRMSGSAPGPVPEVPGPPSAADTAARSTPPEPAEMPPAKPGEKEEPMEAKVETAEAAAAKEHSGGGGESSGAAAHD